MRHPVTDATNEGAGEVRDEPVSVRQAATMVPTHSPPTSKQPAKASCLGNSSALKCGRLRSCVLLTCHRVVVTWSVRHPVIDSTNEGLRLEVWAFELAPSGYDGAGTAL